MKLLILIAVLTVATPVFSQDASLTIGSVDFYGLSGLNANQIRDALPLREGDQLSHMTKVRTIQQLKEAVKRATGREPSDVATICCDDRGRLMIYIGLRDDSVRQAVYNPSPRGSALLPRAALYVQWHAEQAWLNAMEKGETGEDDSRGYALSLDPEARTKQLALHAYVVRHSRMVRRVLASSRAVEHRRIAAEMLGYAERSPPQIAALIRASHDVDDGVRNNAIRALVVLARSSSEAAAIIPGECFVGLLNSGLWTDRNKSAELLSVLTAQRNPQLLTCLRQHALTSLVEMARWSNLGHASGARLMLGRIAGIEERTLTTMLGNQETIISTLTTQKNNGNSAPCRRPLCSATR